MVILRTVGSFDALYNARTFLPVIFPIGLVLAGQFTTRRECLVHGLAWIICIAGGVSAVRGISRQIGGEVGPAVPLLKSRLRKDDGVQINDFAFSLTAYIPQRTYRAWPEFWLQNPKERFLVVAAQALDHSGTPGTVDPAWQSLCGQLVRQGSHQWLMQTPGLLVLERTAPRPSR
jgi:hypothetical protein